MRNGFAIIYYKDGRATQRAFKWTNQGPKEFGKLRDVTKQLAVLEERENIDLDVNQQIGEQMDEDTEVSRVIFNAGRDGFDRSLYEMDNGVFTLAELGERKHPIVHLIKRAIKTITPGIKNHSRNFGVFIHLFTNLLIDVQIDVLSFFEHSELFSYITKFSKLLWPLICPFKCSLSCSSILVVNNRKSITHSDDS